MSMTNNAFYSERAIFTISPMIMIAITLAVSVFNQKIKVNCLCPTSKEIYLKGIYC